MISEHKKREELDKILASQEFKDSKSYKKLLSYLVTSTIEEKEISEVSIAIDGMGKKGDFDNSTDASVRVYIHNLRKKLASYYLNEGKFDEIKISIPKGEHYKAIFTEQKNSNKISKTTLAAVVFVLVVTVLNVFLWIVLDRTPINSDIIDQVIWQELENNEKPLLLVFGDFYVFKDTSTSPNRYIRDISINSESQFSEFQKSDTENAHYQSTEISFLGKSSIANFKHLFNIVSSMNVPYKTILSSELTYDDLTQNNIIYIGSFKSLGIINNLLTDLSTSYRIHPNTIFFKDEEHDTTYTYKAPKNTATGFLKDFSLVSLLPGPNDTRIIIFTGTHDIGQIGALHSFTDLSFLEDLDSKLVDDAPFFEAILEIDGYERTGFDAQLIHFKNIKADK